MNSYHLEHPKYPRLYRFVPLSGEVLVEKWEGGKRLWVKNMSKSEARGLYKYLMVKVGYRVFGFSVKDGVS